MPYDIITDSNGKIIFNVQLIDISSGKYEIKKYQPAEISAMLLQKMKDIVSNFLGYEIKNAVITVPAYFNDSQRSATRDSAIIAGLNPLRIINEPTSASLCYGFEGNDGTILVFDLGGGTFDVSILEIQSGVFNVLSTNGNTHLGGEDFDRRIMDNIYDLIINKHGIKFNDDDEDYFHIMGKIKETSEKIKKSLSNKLAERVNIEIRNKNISVYFTRNQFETMCSDLFQNCFDPVTIALNDAGLRKDQIDQIVLVGGSTRIPKICKMLEEMFDDKPLNRKINPDEAVAYGACIQGAILSKSDYSGKTNDIVLVDVIPLSLGIRGLNGVMSKIIQKNSSIPIVAKQTYTTTEDNQESVSVKVYEGEREFVENNHLLGTFELSGIQKAIKGIPKIEIEFNIDANGILNVKATDLNTFTSSNIEINNHHGLTEEEIEIMIRDAELNRCKDSVRKEILEFIYNFHEYLDQVLRDINNPDINVLTPDEISNLNQLIMNNKEWLDDQSVTHTKEQLEYCRDEMKFFLEPYINKVYAIMSNNQTEELIITDIDSIVNNFLEKSYVKKD